MEVGKYQGWCVDQPVKLLPTFAGTVTDFDIGLALKSQDESGNYWSLHLHWERGTQYRLADC
jgi:hypothetical protein